MDSYERFIRAMDFEEPDYTPIFDSIDNDLILREVGGSGPPKETVPKAFRRLGVDATFQGFWGGSKTSGGFIGGGESWGDEYISEMEWKTLAYRNLLFEKPFTIRWTAKYPTNWIVSRPFKTLEELQDLRISLIMSEDELVEKYVANYREIKRAYEKAGVVAVGVCGGILEGLAGQILGWSLFVRALYQARDFVRKMMDMLLIEARANVKAYVEAEVGPAFLYADDIAHKHGLMHPLVFLREEWVPRVKKIIQPAQKAGIFIIHHSEGNTTDILPDLINIGIRGINPLEPFSMNLQEIKERFGDKLVLTGGIDNAYLLQHGTQADIEKAVKDCIEIAAPGSGYCPGSSGNINPGTPLVNAITLYKAIKKYGKYPRM
ncbi:MAG: uroporphyrinogen decarboxylase family protein [Candidatus Bathyarchaeia archaeon]